MNVNQVKELALHIEGMEASEKALCGMVDRFGKENIRNVFNMIADMDSEDLFRMFRNHHVAELEFHRKMLKNCGVNVEV